MNSVSANGYQVVISTSQATAQADVNIATIQVCMMYRSIVSQNIVQLVEIYMNVSVTQYIFTFQM
jgi:hypothetical protein